METHGHSSDLHDDLRVARRMSGIFRSLFCGLLASTLALAPAAFAQNYPGALSNTATITMPNTATDPVPGDNSGTDTNTLAASADLSVVKTLTSGSPAAAGTAVTYQMVVTNAGPSVATDATITDTVPSELTNVSWTCVASGSSSCGAASGTGNVNVLVTVGVGGANGITVTVTGTAPASGTIGANTAVVTPPVGTTDPNPGDNSSTTPAVPVTPPPTLSIDDVTVSESAGTAVFTVSLSASSTLPVTVAYATADGTATAGADYTSASGTLTFVPGETSKTITVSITNDTVDEADETFTVGLSVATNATIGDGSGLGTITDEDASPSLSIDDVSVDEAAGSAVFTVTLNAISGQQVTVAYATADGTATAGTDYTATSGTLTFAPGETSKTVAVSITNDTIDEADETYTVGLSGPTNATISDGSGLGTITDNDNAPPDAVDDTATVAEDSGATAIDVLANDSDPDGGTLTITGNTNPTNGTVVCTTTGCTYTPNANYVGPDSFTYTISDGQGGTDTATVSITVTETTQLRLVKQTSSREVRVGDLVRYTVSIENVGQADAIGAVLVDTPPAGFTYVAGSLLVDDADDSALLTATNPIRIEGIDVPVGGHATVVYYLRVGAGVAPGRYSNHIVANDAQGGTISNDASAEVTVGGDPLVDESLILGSVFDDRNGNGIQDMGERGVPGVRIASVEGLVMETDAHGRYHLVGVPVDNKARGRNFILKVDPATLPPGTVFTTANPLVRRITGGVPVRFDFGVKLPDGQLGGGKSSIDINLADLLFAPGNAEIKPEHADAIDRIASTVRQHGGGRLTITATGDGEALALRRAQAVQAALQEKLGADVREHTSVDVVSRIEPQESLVSLGKAVSLGSLMFDTDREAIRPQYQALIREIAAIIERQQGGTVEVHGHADRRGSDAYNMKLGMRRAKTVADAITALLSPELRARLRVEPIDPGRSVAGPDSR